MVAAETYLGAVRRAIEETDADLAVVSVHGQPIRALENIDEHEAYQRLRGRARADGVSLVEVATAVVRARGLLRAHDDDGG